MKTINKIKKWLNLKLARIAQQLHEGARTYPGIEREKARHIENYHRYIRFYH
jgi:hypothetical protein